MAMPVGAKRAFNQAAGWTVAGCCAAFSILYFTEIKDAAGGMLGLRSPRTDAELYALKTVAAALDLRSADPNWRDALSPARTTG